MGVDIIEQGVERSQGLLLELLAVDVGIVEVVGQYLDPSAVIAVVDNASDGVDERLVSLLPVGIFVYHSSLLTRGEEATDSGDT